MSPLLRKPGTEAGEEEALCVFLLYDHMANGLRAKQMIDAVARDFERDGAVRRHVWKFNVLCVSSEYWWRAVDDAIQSDMLIFAADGEQPVPAEVAALFTSWSSECKRGRGMVVGMLNGNEADEPNPFLPKRLLEDAAERAAVRLFICNSRLRESALGKTA